MAPRITLEPNGELFNVLKDGKLFASDLTHSQAISLRSSTITGELELEPLENEHEGLA